MIHYGLRHDPGPAYFCTKLLFFLLWKQVQIVVPPSEREHYLLNTNLAFVFYRTPRGTISAWTPPDASSALSSYDLLSLCHNPQWLPCTDGLWKFAESARHLCVIVYSHVRHRKLTHRCSFRDSHIQNIGQGSDQTVSLFKPAPVSHSHLPAPCLCQCVRACVLNVT